MKNKFWVIAVVAVFIFTAGKLEAQVQGAFWTGDGGRGIRVTVAEPTGIGLLPEDELLLPLVQSTIIGAFQRFSAMTVFDRQNLENILQEQLLSTDAHFSDADFIQIGHLTNARYVVFGSITRMAAIYVLELAVTDVQTGLRRASILPSPVSLTALHDLSAIRMASADLLGQLGVNLTQAGQQELGRREDIARIQAETALARGIVAHRHGTMAEAMVFYFQAAAFDPALREAISRASVVSANISSGSLGESIMSRVQEYDEWVAILGAAGYFFRNHLPYELTYNTDIRHHGTNFERRTADFSTEISLFPTEAWDMIHDLRNGLVTAARGEWPHIPHAVQMVFMPRDASVTATLEIVNGAGIAIATATHRFGVLNETNRVNHELFFHDVNADLLIDPISIRVADINGVPAHTVGESGLLRITSTDGKWGIDIEKAELLRQQNIAREHELRQQRMAERQQNRDDRSARWNARNRGHAFLLSTGYLWGNQPETGATLHGFEFGMGWNYLIPFLFLTFGLEGRIGLLGTGVGDDRESEGLYGVGATSFGFEFPISRSGNTRLFGKLLVEKGYFGHWHGTVLDWATPGAEAGLKFGDGLFTMRYRYVSFMEESLHSVILSLGGFSRRR